MEVQTERRPKNLLAKTVLYFKKNGAKKGFKKIHNKFFRLETVSYEKWQKGALPSAYELERQRRESAAWKEEKNHPFFSIAVPMYHTPQAYLEALIDSVQRQTYDNWELCLADGSSKPCAWLEGEQTDARIHYRFLGENRGIAGNTNEALSMAQGDYIVLADHDDLLAPDALYSLAAAIRADAETDFLYSDEDKVDPKGKKYYEPHFKPDFNEDLLRSMNYICHLTAVRRSLAEEAGGFSPDFDGAQDYDFIFRCTEKARKIVHIPKILYHWRCHPASTAENPDSKRYAFEAGARAVLAHYERLGIKAQVKEGVKPGMYETCYERPYDPLVTVIIPNKDHREDLERTISSVRTHTAYQKLEWLIVDRKSVV